MKTTTKYALAGSALTFGLLWLLAWRRQNVAVMGVDYQMGFNPYSARSYR